MRKVTKILLRVLSAIVLLLIILPLLPALLLAIPAVQNMAIDKAAAWAGDYLGTTVKVGHITVGLLNRVAVRDFYVADWDGDTLLYVKRADAYFGSLSSLAKKNLVINYGNVQGGKFVVRETDRGTFAVKEITDQLVALRKGKKSEFRLDIHSLKGSGIDFMLYRNDDHNEVGVDYSDMRLLGIETHINDFYVENSAVGGDIQSLSFTERSGFKLDNLLGYFYVYEGKVEVKNARLQTASSDINLDNFLLDGVNWDKYKDKHRISKGSICSSVSRLACPESSLCSSVSRLAYPESLGFNCNHPLLLIARNSFLRTHSRTSPKSPQKSMSRILLPENQWVYSPNI